MDNNKRISILWCSRFVLLYVFTLLSRVCATEEELLKGDNHDNFEKQEQKAEKLLAKNEVEAENRRYKIELTDAIDIVNAGIKHAIKKVDNNTAIIMAVLLPMCIAFLYEYFTFVKPIKETISDLPSIKKKIGRSLKKEDIKTLAKIKPGIIGEVQYYFFYKKKSSLLWLILIILSIMFIRKKRKKYII